MILGIDFGTCFSTFAYMNGNIPTTGTSIDAQGIPTIFMNLNGRECFGEECNTIEAKRHREDIIRYIKKEIRQNPEKFDDEMAFSSGEKYYSGKDIIKKLLSYLIGYAKNQAIMSGECESTEIEQITITTPIGIATKQMTATDYNQKIKELTMEITGLTADKVRILEEPIAAAISFLESEEERNKDQSVLIFDLGGGTLDISVVEHNTQEKKYTIIAKEGNLELGGTNWDEALEQYIVENYEDEIDLDDFEDDDAFRFKEQIVEWKMQLSTNDFIDGVIRHGNDKIMIEMERDEFEEETEFLLNNAIDTLNQVMEKIARREKTINKIILVGGSCNMPQIRNRIVTDYSYLGEENILLFEPSKAIAKGAAIYAKRMDLVGEVDIPSFINLVSHTYGFSTYNKVLGRSMIYNLLYRGTPIPSEESVIGRAIKSDPDSTTREISFRAKNNNCKSILFTIYESDSEPENDIENHWMDHNSGGVANGMVLTIPIPTEFWNHAKDFHCHPQLEITQDEILIFTVTDSNGNIIGRVQKDNM